MRYKIPLLVILVTLVFFAALYLIPATSSKIFVIDSSFDIFSSFIVKEANWQKWLPASSNNTDSVNTANTNKLNYSNKTFKVGSAQDSFLVHTINPLSYTITMLKKESPSAPFSIGYIPGTSDKKVTIVLIEKTNLLSKIIPLYGQNDFAVSAVERLKHFLETPELLYGFKVEKVSVEDTVYATTKTATTFKNMFADMPGAFGKITNYIQSQQLAVTGAKSISYLPMGKMDSLYLFTGIPVNKISTETDDIQFLQMPHKGILLLAHYNGRFGQRNNLYDAMKKYIADNHFTLIANPYEQYNNELPASDSSMVNLKLYFPVR